MKDKTLIVATVLTTLVGLTAFDGIRSNSDSERRFGTVFLIAAGEGLAAIYRRRSRRAVDGMTDHILRAAMRAKPPSLNPPN